MRKQYASFTLLEVMISLVLIGIVLTLVFTFFKQTLISKSQAFHLKEKTLCIELLKVRLNHLFDHCTEKEKCHLATLTHVDAVGPALLIHCDQGIHPDPAFSGLLYSMLFKTRDQRLCLCTWSKNNAGKIDTLLTQVKECSFSFFSEKRWQSTWDNDQTDTALPTMVQISVLFLGEGEMRQDFIFSLPSSSEILYEKKDRFQKAA